MRLSSKDLQTFLKSNMGYRRYSLSELYSVYTGVLNRDYFIPYYEVMCRESFRLKLNAISNVEGSWLISEGIRKTRTYRAVEPEPCCKFSATYDKAMELYANVKGIVICQK